MLETFIQTQLYAFLLIFARVGSAMVIMPGIGATFTPTNVRLMLTLGLCIVMTPVLSPQLPALPTAPAPLFLMLGAEMVTGFFIGTVMRLFMSALDVAGMIIGLNTGLANAQVFNPAAGGQGSIIGAFLGVAGMTFIFVSGMHHYLLITIFESYSAFPADSIMTDTGQMAEVIAKVTNTAFSVGVKMSMPFVIMTLVVYTGFGILGRLMPQIQVFFLALPLQILLALITMTLVFSTILIYFLSSFEEMTTQYIAP